MCCCSCTRWFSSGRLLWVSYMPCCLVTKPHQLRHKSYLFSALWTPVVILVFSLLKCRHNQVRQPQGALRAASCSGLCNRGTTGALKWSRGFSFALQKAIGIEEAPLWPGKSQFGSGSLGLLVAVFERWGEERRRKVFPRAAEILVTVISNKCQSNL